jgi:hypothetical protein
MADYGGRGGGQSLRDALNQLYPMTGLGEYNTMFPPQTGAPQPGPPVPLPQPRPPGAPGFPPYAPMAGAALAQAPGLAARGGLPPGLAPQGQLGIEGAPRSPMVGGGARFPINPNLALQAGGQFAPGNYAARLGLTGRF